MSLEIVGKTINGVTGKDSASVYSFFKEDTFFTGDSSGSVAQWDYSLVDDQASVRVDFNAYENILLTGQGNQNSTSDFTGVITSNVDLKGKDFFVSGAYSGINNTTGTASIVFNAYIMKGATQQITLFTDDKLLVGGVGLTTGGGWWLRGWWTGTVLNYQYGVQNADSPGTTFVSGTLDFGTDTCGVRIRMTKANGSISCNGYYHLSPMPTMNFNNFTPESGF